jgi:hypothetical protein
MHALTLRFTKGAHKHDSLEMLCPDGRVALIDCPKQGILPHDMVHAAVEHTLSRHGFLARVAQGEAASFQMGGEAESDGVERLVEVMQADGWSGWQTPASELLSLYEVTCAARECPALPVSEADVEAIRSRILELQAQWGEVAVGGSLTLSFLPDV